MTRPGVLAPWHLAWRSLRALGRAVSDFSPPPKETHLRLCPNRLSLAIMPVGRVVAARTALRGAYRCKDCTKEFVLLR